MNAHDDSTESDGDDPYRADDEGSPLDKLSKRIAAVLALLGEARAAAEKAGPGASPRLLAEYRVPFNAAMEALADALADAFEQAPQAFDRNSPDNPLTPLLDKARDLPLVRRAQQSISNDEDDHELQRVLLNGRGAGFDLPSLLLENYFQETVFVRTFRGRIAALGELLRDEVRRRVESGQKEVRLLYLRCGGLLELEPLLEHPLCAAHAAFTFVDDSTSALRITRQNIERRLALRPRFVKADPLTVGENINRPRPPFDLLVTFSLFDMLPTPAALGLARNCHTLVKPGGALITSGYLPDVPRGENALALGFLGARVNYWDESAWRNLLQRASFDCSAIRFERRPPAALALLAPRGETPVLQL
jgi:SAM-dependent methyltransferase